MKLTAGKAIKSNAVSHQRYEGRDSNGLLQQRNEAEISETLDRRHEQLVSFS